ncbi:MAG TPA: hypothetical protein PLD59_07670 [Tepidisphaeraceae bacterium]|nr:hypothetical protein [Tepidisphaeraceae bacterium]
MNEPADEPLLPAEEALRRVPDGGVLHTLHGGLMIVRRLKHEWNEQLDSMSPAALARHTDKVRGSKFLASWTLTAYVNWTRQQVERLDWDSSTTAGAETVEIGSDVGYSSGRMVQKVRIVISSRCIHAYPVPE